MNTQTHEVAMKVNQANLVKSLRVSFTNKTTVLGELIQNARRANAAMVVINFCPETKTLQVLDDGCGIDSIATLLTGVLSPNPGNFGSSIITMPYEIMMQSAGIN